MKMKNFSRLLIIYARYGYKKGRVRIKRISYAISLQTESNRFRALMLIQRLHVQKSEDINADMEFIGRVLGYSYLKPLHAFKVPELNINLPNYGLVKGEM